MAKSAPLPPIEELHSAVHQALRTWNQLDSSEEELLAFLLLVQKARTENAETSGRGSRREATNRVLESAIATLAESDERAATLLRSRFIEEEITRRVAVRLHASVDQVNRWQRAAITDLARILQDREKEARAARLRRLETVLPSPTYTRLFGFEGAKKEVSNALLRAGEPWSVTIAGIGGIGKTSLAHAVVRDVIQTLAFERVCWLRAPAPQQTDGDGLDAAPTYQRLLQLLAEQIWPEEPGVASSAARERRLRHALRARPYLIVIDNLEDEETTAYVLNQIRSLTTPSKFLLTARAHPAVAASTYFVSLDELPEEEATALVRDYADTIGLTALTEADPATLAAIYEVTGGNPLALKLVASLAAVLPLPQILADLQRVRPGPIEDLYRNIYWESWRTLSERARTLLQAMPLVAESGARPAQMQAISDLSEDDFWPAVTELVARCLLEVHGALDERRYSIHRLTETFLRTEIIHWPE